MPFLGNVGSTEFFIIALALFAIFGGKKLHEWSQGVGQAGKEVRKVKQELEEGFTGEITEEITNEPLEEPKIKHKKNKKAAGPEGGVN